MCYALCYICDGFFSFSLFLLCVSCQFGSRCVCGTCCCGFETALSRLTFARRSGAGTAASRPSLSRILFLCGLTLFCGIFGIEYLPLGIKLIVLCVWILWIFFFFPCSVSTSINEVKGSLAPSRHSRLCSSSPTRRSVLRWGSQALLPPLGDVGGLTAWRKLVSVLVILSEARDPGTAPPSVPGPELVSPSPACCL